MSSDPVGGYLIFPSTLSRADLIAVTLQAMELGPEEFEVRLPDEEGFPRLPEEGFPFRTVEPPERALALLAEVESGVINSRDVETYWLEPVIAAYQPLTIWITASAMRYRGSPDKVIELYTARWLHLCEQGQAVLGYFSPFGFMNEHDYLEEKILPALQREDLPELLAAEVNWLIYLGPELAERWRQEQTPFPSPPLISQDLPSGAHFFRTSTSVFG